MVSDAGDLFKVTTTKPSGARVAICGGQYGLVKFGSLTLDGPSWTASLGLGWVWTDNWWLEDTINGRNLDVSAINI